ncbi:hypothetical protein BBW65_02450 [Helicobacter enhydrae]|uniref:Type I restriction modification DNA specificity domain-containing protein n=1 Tax=Helicobacter enhydrae TaxID=222136 RepID=A0A1B1U4L0_9HELI|nr:restriction endonuclease subunit S [Helicobacter enhydrae]ANV97734.1 hypothetical protein BBW65_02450 [Helicobacter enhydrae]
MSSVKVVRFKDFIRWDTGFHFGTQDLKSKFKLEYLEKILVPRKEKIKPNEYDGITPIVAKIPFSSSHIELRKELKTRMDMYAVYNGDLLVSNINFHQGAVAICREGRIYASTHYQPYIINEEMINKEFLYLILKQSSYLEYIATKRIKGIKTESKFNFIKTLQIPLPPLSFQNKIINDLKAMENEIKILQDVKIGIEKEINECISKVLEIDTNTQVLNKTGTKVVCYKDLKLFDYKSNVVELNEFVSSYPKYKFSYFLTRKLNRVKIIDKTLYKRVRVKTKAKGLSLRDNVFGENIRTKNQFVINKGQFLISKIDARNGSFGIVDDELDNAIVTADFLNFDINRNVVNDKFLIMILKTPYYIEIFNSLSSGTTGRKRINEQKLLDIDISLPLIAEQDNLMLRLTNIDKKIEKFSTELNLLREKIINDLSSK